jgi:hypothetical protein
LPTGVRTASIIKTSFMVIFFLKKLYGKANATFHFYNSNKDLYAAND